MNGPQKSNIGGHFCKICAYDPMSPSSATPVYSISFPIKEIIRVETSKPEFEFLQNTCKCGL